MRIFWSIAAVAYAALAGLSLVACSSDKDTAGIEIGNPSIADKDTVTSPTLPDELPALALTADFSVDYSDADPSALKKGASVKDEPVLLDSFAMALSEVRMYSSYYSYKPDYSPVEGSRVWPVFELQDEEHAVLDTMYVPPTLTVSFTEGTFVEDAFKNIELLDGGYLKEIGVAFENVNLDDIRGRAEVDGELVPFVYDMSNFQSVLLRYHYSQIEIDSVNNKANLAVVFHAKTFTAGVDFSKATVSEDGVIYIDKKNNVDLWYQMNENFIPSFRPLQYTNVDEDGVSTSGFVNDVWGDLAPGVKENALINGNFKSPFTTNWILVTQYGGKADTSVIVEKGGDRIMMVNVTDGGDSSFSVQLLQENVALVKDARYQCVFTIWSDVADSITARIGAYDTYKTIGFSEHVFVGTSGKSVQIEFVAQESNAYARFELNLGKKKRWFRIKDLQVLRLTK